VLGLKVPRIIKVRVGGGTVSIKGTLTVITVIPDTVKTRVKRLFEERMKCRQEKNWQRADEIRKKLAELGVTSEDTKEGTDITYKSVPSEGSLDRLLAGLGIVLEDTPKGTIPKYKR